MKLTEQQLRDFDREGWLFLPERFSREEVDLLRAEAHAIYATERQEVWRETSGAPRTAFAVHTYHPVFKALVHHPRFVEPAEQLLRDKTYIHQFKINGKAAFDGDVWQWHQDYGTWARDDGMPAARAMNIAVFLDEVMPINGPLLLIPGSHRQGVFEAGHDKLTTSYPLWTLDKETVTRLAREAAGPDGVGIVAPTGKPGSVLMFHGNLVHASPPNITPYPRKMLFKISFIEDFLGIGKKEEPGEGNGKQAGAAPSGKESSKGSNKEVAYAAAYDLFKDGKYDKARTEFQSFLKQYPDTEYSDNAQFWIGECYYFEKKYENAILEYEKVVKTYSEGDKVPHALLKEGFSFLNLGDKASAKLVLQRVIKDYPNTNQARTARAKLLSIK